MEEIEIKTHELVISASEAPEMLLDDSLREKVKLLYFKHLKKLEEEFFKTMMIESEFRRKGFFYGSDREGNKPKGWDFKANS